MRPKTSDHTFTVCQQYFKNPNTHTLKRVKLNLRRWARRGRPQLEDYGYSGVFGDHIGYCQDRMNSGRAKALLRLLAAEGKEGE